MEPVAREWTNFARDRVQLKDGVVKSQKFICELLDRVRFGSFKNNKAQVMRITKFADREYIYSPCRFIFDPKEGNYKS
jgi:hypothetical protein